MKFFELFCFNILNKVNKSMINILHVTVTSWREEPKRPRSFRKKLNKPQDSLWKE